MIDLEWLAERLEALSAPVPGPGCLLWIGGMQSSGYGLLSRKGEHILAHRAAYLLAHGEIPEGMDVCHKCDTRLCINPSHLFAGTRSDNMRDMVAKGRANSVHGERHRDAKLTEAQVLAIRSDRRSQRKIAADYGVYFATIGGIKRRETWKHVGEAA